MSHLPVRQQSRASLDTSRVQWRIADSLSEEDVRSQIDVCGRLSINVRWSGGGDHVLTVVGYTQLQNGLLLVSIEDPLLGVGVVPLEVLLTRYLMLGRWTHAATNT